MFHIPDFDQEEPKSGSFKEKLYLIMIKTVTHLKVEEL